MASKKAYVDHLRSVPLFAGCTRKELERIARSGDEIKMTAGSLVVDQGQTGREAFVILDGTVTVKRNGRKVATLGPGAIVGELSLLDHGPADGDRRVRHRLHAVRHLPAPLPRRRSTTSRRSPTSCSPSLAGRIRELDRAVLRLTSSAAPIRTPDERHGAMARSNVGRRR